jgi:RND superfamily putative drug exporter
MLTGVDLLSEMGFAVAAGIILVAIVMASVLIPSLATLMGERLWWPGHKPEAAGADAHARPVSRPQPTGELAPVRVRGR